MHPRQEQQIRSNVRKLIYYAEQFNVPKSQMVNEVEKKMRIQLEPSATEEDYTVAKIRVRAIIEEMVSDR